MSARQAAALHAALHGAIITAGYVLAAYILIGAAWYAWRCCRHPRHITGREEQQIRDALTAELAELELQDILRRGMP